MRLNQDVIGKDSEQTASTINDIFRSFFMIETPLPVTNLETARLIKYTSNVSQPTNPLNEVANLCVKVGGVVRHLARAMELEKPIELKFPHPVRLAIYTRSGLEQEVKRELGRKGIENFLPLNGKKSCSCA